MNDNLKRCLEILGENIQEQLHEILMDCLQDNNFIDKKTTREVKKIINGYIDNCTGNINDNGINNLNEGL